MTRTNEDDDVSSESPRTPCATSRKISSRSRIRPRGTAAQNQKTAAERLRELERLHGVHSAEEADHPPGDVDT